MSTWDYFQQFLDRYGVAVAMVGWFMFRLEKLMTKLTSRVNRLIIANVLIAKTLELDEESEKLILAAGDDDDEAGDTGNAQG